MLNIVGFTLSIILATEIGRKNAADYGVGMLGGISVGLWLFILLTDLRERINR